MALWVPFLVEIYEIRCFILLSTSIIKRLKLCSLWDCFAFSVIFVRGKKIMWYLNYFFHWSVLHKIVQKTKCLFSVFYISWVRSSYMMIFTKLDFFFKFCFATCFREPDVCWFFLYFSCNKYSFDLSYVEKTTTETLVLGVGPVKAQLEGAEMGVASENGGCNCGSSCTCDPCNCK